MITILWSRIKSREEGRSSSNRFKIKSSLDKYYARFEQPIKQDGWRQTRTRNTSVEVLTTVQWIFIFHLFEDTWRKRTLTEVIDNRVLEKGEIVKLCNDFGNLYCSWLTNVSRTSSTGRLLCILYQQWARGSIYTCVSSIVKRFELVY